MENGFIKGRWEFPRALAITFFPKAEFPAQFVSDKSIGGRLVLRLKGSHENLFYSIDQPFLECIGKHFKVLQIGDSALQVRLSLREISTQSILGAIACSQNEHRDE